MVKSIGKRTLLLSIIIIALIPSIVGCAVSRNNNIANNKLNPISYSEFSSIPRANSTLIPEVVEKVNNAVVGVATRSIINDGIRNGAQVEEGIGSGFIINEQGYVLTNHHVIADASSVKVIFSNNTEAEAQVVNFDENQDLAVLKIIDGSSIPGVVELGDSDGLKVGETVIAIGNPLGKEFIGTVTSGIVSAVNRDIVINNRILSFIQTDAAINPGNSGGPLLDTSGKVIGINTAKIGATGIEGIGFSIPINIVKGRLSAMATPIPKLGMIAMKVTPEMTKYENVPTGVFVNKVNKNGCCCTAGLKCGDIIVKFDGEEVKSIDEINAIKEKHKVGDSIEVVIYRNGFYRTKKLRLTE
ncbi:MAG TPA: deoxyribonuclease HsdR [Clostridium sp.]|jgi:serine protease Do|nr:deoxyribonuclease HsdR [Clostridium sp.]